MNKNKILSIIRTENQNTMVRIYHKQHNQKSYQDMTIEEWLEWIKTHDWFYITYLS